MTNDNDRADPGRELEAFRQHFFAAGSPLLVAFAEIESMRAGCDQLFLDGLESILSSEHPALTDRLHRLRQRKATEHALRAQASRLRLRSEVADSEALVSGIVLDSLGQPLKGVNVSIVADSDKEFAAIADTDENGIFSIVVSKAQEDDVRQSLSGWRLRVTNQGGETLYLSDDPFAPSWGGALYSEIRTRSVTPKDREPGGKH